ncbi:ABC transporter substrate-binding protein [Phytohabitans flavus]|uniref:ABC transporter substrate-binding protein n=1 Tax=Phytohabitans flavus TaxID=1076124 RepID=UPI00363635CF
MNRNISRRSLLRAVGGGAALAGTAAFAAACGGGESATSADPKVVRWWDYTTDQAPVDNMLKKFMAENPDIKVERRSIPYDDTKRILLQSAGQGSLPDIVVVNNPDHQQFAELGIAEDITDRLKTWRQTDLYVQAAVQSATWNGRNYGLPQQVNCLALWYNTEALEQAKLEVPTDWASLRAAAKALTKSPRYGMAYSAPNNQSAVYQWLPTLWQAGGDLTDLGGPAANKALQFWTDLMKDGSVSREALNWSQPDIGTEFGQQRAAMMINGPFMVPTLKKDAPDLKWGVAQLPKDVAAASCLGGENYMIIKGGNVDGAWKLLEWTQKPENLVEYLKATGGLPSRSDIAGDAAWADEVSQVFAEQLKVARPRAYGTKYPEIATAVTTAIQSALSGTAPVDKALSTAATAVKPLLPK